MAHIGANKLNMIQSSKVIGLIESNYKESGMTDRDFAEMVTKQLGFHVVAGHIQTRRSSLGITANELPRKASAYDELEARITTLEQRIEEAARQFAELKKLFGEE